ncbi:MAG: amidase [Emcibacteraceae bacterium]|nr:amidase [Emcibacteraceae bacterium]
MPYRISQLSTITDHSVRVNNMTRRHFCALAGGAALGGALAGCSPNGEVPKVALDNMYYSSLTDTADLIKSGEISPVELTKSMFERIETVDPQLKSYATLTYDRAMEAAIKAEQEITSGNYRGPMHGIPIAVKDLCYTKGTRTMGGLSVLKDFIPNYDATVVSRLESAGSIILGKLNLTEGAMAGYHPDFDIPVNPWDSKYWTGGSSSGSGVAVAAGLCFGALGTDTGGSIRYPSMANGNVGLKPTYGRVSRYGVLPLAESLDHVGPMTRTTADAAIMLQTIAGYDENDPTSLTSPVPDMLSNISSGVAGMRIGFDSDYATTDINAGLVKAIEETLNVLTDLGATIVQMKMPEDTKAMSGLWMLLCAHEAAIAHNANYPSRSNEYGPYFREFLEYGVTVTPEQYANASEHRRNFTLGFDATLSMFDAIICPSGGVTVPIEVDSLYGNAQAVGPVFAGIKRYFALPADFSGTPTLTIPCGLSDAGIPYTLQLMGSRLSEARLCQIGHSYEQVTNWHKLHPSI